MPSDAFIGVLTGLAGAHKERQKNLFDQEVERREQMAKMYEKLAEHPSMSPEGQEQYFRRAFDIRTLEPSKKMPKEWESFISEVAPKFGQSWLGGQTTRQVEAQNMPIPTALPTPGMTPSLGEVQGGKVPTKEPMQSQQALPRQTPPPSTFQAPMPQPPPGTTRSAFLSPQEMAQQKIAEAIQTLQALGPIHLEQALAKKKGEIALEPDKAFGFGRGGLATESGKILRQPEAEAPLNPPNWSSGEFKVDGKGPVTVISPLDPQAPKFGREFVRTAQGLQEVTGRTTPYEKPVQPPATFQITGATQDAVAAMPSDIGDALAKATLGMQNQGQRLNAIQTVQRMLQRGDRQAVRNTIKQLAVEGEPVDDRRRISSQRTVINALQEIGPLLEAVPTNLLAGTIEDVTRALGATQDPRYVYIATRLTQLNQNYRRGMTGAQFSIPEAKEYASVLPDIGNLPVVNKAQINAMIDAFAAESDTYWNFKLGPQWSDRFDKASPTPPPGGAGAGGEAPEGTIVVDAQGNRKVKRGGQWVNP